MIVRLAPLLRRLAVVVTVGALALAGGCILGPKQDDPSSTQDMPVDSGIFGSGDASADTSAGGCVDDGSHGHETGPGYDACPAPPADGAFDVPTGDTVSSDAPGDAGDVGDVDEDTSVDDAVTGD